MYEDQDCISYVLEGKTGSVYTNILRVAKALVVSEPIVAWQNLAEFGSGTIL